MILKLAEELSITTAPEIRDALAAALREHEAVELDGAGVGTIDLAGLQLLCAAHKTATLAGKTISFADGARGEAIDRAASVGGFHAQPGCTPGCLWQRRTHE